MNSKTPELVVIMPVYNEGDAVVKVLEKWNRELVRLEIDYQIKVFNDGSVDNTLDVLNEYASTNKRVVVHDKKNSGHGPTVLLGYRENSDVPWIFQIDSDDEIGTQEFEQLWSNRNEHDFLIGKRLNRNSPLARRIISFISRMTVVLFYNGSGVYDVNCPYRLMRTERFRQYYLKIPSNTFAPNVVISGLACLKKMRIYETAVSYRFRQSSEVSIKSIKLFKAAVTSFFQTVCCRFSAA